VHHTNSHSKRDQTRGQEGVVGSHLRCITGKMVGFVGAGSSKVKDVGHEWSVLYLGKFKSRPVKLSARMSFGCNKGTD